MNNITDLLDLEDSDIIISDISIQGTNKNITLETRPVPHFCPSCGFRMHSRGIKQRTINHPILQDNYSLTLILKLQPKRGFFPLFSVPLQPFSGIGHTCLIFIIKPKIKLNFL